MNKDEYLDFLFDFLERDWLLKEYKNIEERSPLKERGARFQAYHPYVKYIYEINYLLRRAEIEKQETVLMKENQFVLFNTGKLFYHCFDKYPNHGDLRERLRNPKQFDDVSWELEVGAMLGFNKIPYRFREPDNDYTNDIQANIVDRPIEIECKNKIIENEQYKVNNLFSMVLTNKLSELSVLSGDSIEIKFEEGRLEDIKTIVKVISKKFDIEDYQSILGRYRIRRKKIITTEYINADDVMAIVDAYNVPKSELYDERSENETFVSRFILKYPKSDTTVKNISGVLKSANKQLKQGGVVFLKVPYSTFSNCVEEIKSILSKDYSKISGVKVVGINIEFLEDKGVKVSREESFIKSSRSILELTDEEIKILEKPMIFTKFSF